MNIPTLSAMASMFSLAAPDDHANSVIPLTFGPGRTSQEVSVPIVDDNLLEAIETFFANLRFPAGGEVFDSIQIAPSRASASITDNNCEHLIYMYACSQSQRHYIGQLKRGSSTVL